MSLMESTTKKEDLKTSTQPQAKPAAAIWTRSFILMLLINLIVFMVHSMQMTTLPQFTLHSGGTSAQVGIVMGVFTVSAVALRPLFGRWVDGKGRRFMLVLGGVFLLVAAVSYPLLAFVSGLLIVRLINGVGFSAHTTAAATMMGDILPPPRLSEGLGYFSLSNIVAMGFGPAFGLYLASLGYPLFFAVTGALSLLGLLATLMVPESRPFSAAAEAKGKAKPAFSISNYVEKTTLRPAIVVFFMALIMGATTSFLPLFGQARELGHIGTFFTVFAVTMLVVRLFTSRLVDRVGPNPVMIISFLFLIATFIVLALAESESMVLTAGVLYGIGSSWPIPAMNAVIIQLAPIARRGAANATFSTFLDTGVGVGIVILGFVADAFDYTVFFLVSALFCLTSLGLYLILLSWRLRKKQGQGSATD